CSADTCHHIDGKGLPFPEQSFRKPAQAQETPHIESHVNEPAMHEAGGQQTPPIATQRPGAIVSSPVGRCSGIKIQETSAGDNHAYEDRKVDSKQRRGCWKIAKRPGGHGPAGAASGYAGATVAQDRRDSFFIYGKSSAAFQAIWHVGNRITKEVK